MIEIKVPAVGESITEATIAEWVKKSGEAINRDDILLVLETDKASVEVVAETGGVLDIKINEGETVEVGKVIGQINKTVTGVTTQTTKNGAAHPSSITESSATAIKEKTTPTAHTQSPAVRKMLAESHLDSGHITGTGKDGRITKGDILNAKNNSSSAEALTPAQARPLDLPLPTTTRTPGSEQIVTREKMSRLRQTIAKRLVQSQQTAATLTTFNEIDMSAIMDLRKKYKESFLKRYNIKLGFMSFFVKATIEALKDFPRINGGIDGNELFLNHFYNIGIAVGTDKGLVVPVVKDADLLSLADIEKNIGHFANKAHNGQISMDDLAGGTFTISNGGTYGSMLSTPILNPPQSGILGLHKIEQRPIAIDGQVVVKPMMYVALSYDHRIIDGSESVRFLVKIKECIEDPSRILLEV